MHLSIIFTCRYVPRMPAPRWLHLAGLCLLFLSASVFSSPAEDEAFLVYLQRAANPDNLGLRADGRFYPYSAPVGRRIGYRQLVTDKKLFRDGWSKKEAEAAFARQVSEVEAGWRQRLQSEFGRSFDELTVPSQEILVDFGVSEGVGNVKPEFVKAAMDLDWKRILDPALYARYETAWPHTERNKAFYDRWSKKVVSR